MRSSTMAVVLGFTVSLGIIGVGILAWNGSLSHPLRDTKIAKAPPPVEGPGPAAPSPLAEGRSRPLVVTVPSAHPKAVVADPTHPRGRLADLPPNETPAFLEAAFDHEGASVWGKETSRTISKALDGFQQKFPKEDIRVDDVECRTELCKVSLSAAHASTAKHVMVDVFIAGGPGGPSDYPTFASASLDRADEDHRASETVWVFRHKS